MAERLTPDADGNVSFAGHKLPTPVAVRLIRALRARYPAVTQGLSDPAAVRAVIRFWFVATLAEAEAQAALAPVGQAVEDVRANFEEKAQTARSKALKDAEAIIEVQGPEGMS